MVLRPGASTTQEDLIAHVKTKIAGYKAPREVAIIGGAAEDIDGEDPRSFSAARKGVGRSCEPRERLKSTRSCRAASADPRPVVS